jgi:multidrug efflux pump subunit AcrA (membrane-fusion protein)
VNNKNELLGQLRIDRSASSSPKGWTLWTAVAVGVLLLIAISFWIFYEPAPLTVKIQMARMATADSSSASVLDATGYVVARRAATVSSKVTGKVMEMLVE